MTTPPEAGGARAAERPPPLNRTRGAADPWAGTGGRGGGPLGHRRGAALLPAASAALLAAGFVVVALEPPWLTGPLRAALEGAGPFAPAAVVALLAVLAPLHLNGVVVVLSPLFFPSPVAFALSFAGTLLGCVATYLVLARAGAVRRGTWPGWLDRLAARVAHRPVLVGMLARVALGSGVAVEAFALLPATPGVGTSPSPRSASPSGSARPCSASRSCGPPPQPPRG